MGPKITLNRHVGQPELRLKWMGKLQNISYQVEESGVQYEVELSLLLTG
ncbi:MAG: hypothetical protein AAGA03_00500 [Planctomycetota bacterium]